MDSQIKEIGNLWDNSAALGWIEHLENQLKRFKKRLIPSPNADTQDAYVFETFHQRAAITKLRVPLDFYESRLSKVDHKPQSVYQWTINHLKSEIKEFKERVRATEAANHGTASDGAVFFSTYKHKEDGGSKNATGDSRNDNDQTTQEGNKRKSSHILEPARSNKEPRRHLLTRNTRPSQATSHDNDTVKGVDEHRNQGPSGQASSGNPLCLNQPLYGNFREDEGIAKFIIAVENLDNSRIWEIIQGPILKEMYKTFDIMHAFPRSGTFRTYRAKAARAIKARREDISETRYADRGAWSDAPMSQSGFEEMQAVKLAKLDEIKALIDDGIKLAEDRRETAMERGGWARSEDKEPCGDVEEDLEYNDLKSEETDGENDQSQDMGLDENRPKIFDKGKARATESSGTDAQQVGNHRTMEGTAIKIESDKSEGVQQGHREKGKAGIKGRADDAQDEDTERPTAGRRQQLVQRKATAASVPDSESGERQ